MTLAILFDWIDIVLLAVVVLTSYDALRQVHPLHQPWRAVTFALISVGGFGWIAYDLHHEPVAWWALAFHLGIASHSVIRFLARNHIHFGDHYVGFHHDRRRLGAPADRRQTKR